MKSPTVAKIKLEGGPEQTVSSIVIGVDGSVGFDFFDFSPMAQEHFGNDVAYTIVVAPVDRPALMRAFALSADAPDDSILAAGAELFQSYFDIQPFLEKHAIPFEKEFDSWA